MIYTRPNGPFEYYHVFVWEESGVLDDRAWSAVRCEHEKPYEAAVAIGYCTLFGVESAPAYAIPLAHRGLVALAARISAATRAAEELPAAWERDRDWTKRCAAAAMVERMDVWAAITAIQEAVAAAGIDERLREELLECQAASNALDVVLWDRVDVIAMLAETRLLTEWRNALTSGVERPWWLDGRLEALVPALVEA